MDEMNKAVLTAMLNFENALIDALSELDEADAEDRLAIFQEIADALVPFKTMTVDDREFILSSLLRRGRIPEHGWDRLDEAMGALANQQPDAHNSRA